MPSFLYCTGIGADVLLFLSIIKPRICSQNGAKGLIMNKSIEKSIGNNIRKLREKREMTQELFATKLQLEGLDITRSAVAKIEVGQRHIYPDEMIVIKRVLGVSYDEIFEYEKNQ